MRVTFHARFVKQLGRLSRKLQGVVGRRLELFERDPFHRLLNNHALTGEYNNHRSINITGDLRAVFYHVSQDDVQFVELGTHSQLYR